MRSYVRPCAKSSPPLTHHNMGETEMKIGACLSLICVLLWCTPAAASDLWWAVAHGHQRLGSTLQSGNTAYGAAWNYPTLEAAIETANALCRKRLPGAGRYNCEAEGGPYGKNSFFYITKSEFRVEQAGMVSLYGAEGHYKTGVEATAAAEDSIAQTNSTQYRDLNPDYVSSEIHFIECAGAQ